MKTEFLDLRLQDNMELMAEFPDKHFDLAIVDPPYGIGEKFKGGGSGKMNFNEVVDKGWDVVPPPAYFIELKRVSKHQIIWGGNYFHLEPSRCFVIWDKMISEDFTLAMAEMAWTSFDKLAKIYRGIVPKDGKQHPTQKPVDLYKWTLGKFANPGQRILDTHMGSGSIAIACHYAKCHLTACEIDPDYFHAACERIKRETAQADFFADIVTPVAETPSLF